MDGLQNWSQHLYLLYVILSFGLIALFLRAANKAYRGPAASVPGPWYTRWTELPLKYYWVRGQRVKWVDSLHQRYGPVVRVRPNEVSIADVQAAREIHRLATPFWKTDFYHKLTGSQPVPRLFTMKDPKQHSARRRLLATPLSESSLKTVEPTVNNNIAKTMDGIAGEMKASGSSDVFKWFLYMATDVIGELSFAESFRMLDQQKPNQYFKDLHTVGIATALRSELGGITSFLGALRLQPFSEVMGSVTRFREYSQQSFKRYEQHVAMNPTNPKPTLFTKMMQKVEKEESLDRRSLIGEGQGFIVAGSDTTANTMTYLVYAVTRHPDVQNRLVDELSALRNDFGWDDLRDLPYLNKCIDETLRLYGPASSALPRHVPQGGAYLAGYHFPSDGKFVVSTQAYTLHRNPSVFPEPERFNPNRWDNLTAQMQQSFMPFGAGARICIGMHLAKNEIRMATASFFRKFPKTQVLSSDEEMDMKAYFLAHPAAKKCIAAVS